jgi:hypothetical protein
VPETRDRHVGIDEAAGRDDGVQAVLGLEVSMLALHLLQSALVLVNTRLVDRILSEPEWAGKMTERDLRGLTPLLWGNVLLHGIFALDLAKRLDYDRVPTADDLDDDLSDESDGDEVGLGVPALTPGNPMLSQLRRHAAGALYGATAAALVRVVPSRPRWSCSFVLAVPV